MLTELLSIEDLEAKTAQLTEWQLSVIVEKLYPTFNVNTQHASYEVSKWKNCTQRVAHHRRATAVTICYLTST